MAASAVALLTSILLHGAASAAICGDDADGRRVPCACGDDVTSNTRLRPTDPVVAERCPVNGLTLSAPADVESITLDLAGLSIRGSGVGIGIRVRRGGCDGSVITGGATEERGTIAGFGTGIRAHTPQALRRLERVVLRDNELDGLWLRTAGTMVLDVVAVDNGEDGIELHGDGGRLVGVTASGNRESGIRMAANGVIVDGSVTANGQHGLVAHGARNDVSGLIASDNGGHGALIVGVANRSDGIVAENNALDGLRIGQGGAAMAGGQDR